MNVWNNCRNSLRDRNTSRYPLVRYSFSLHFKSFSSNIKKAFIGHGNRERHEICYQNEMNGKNPFGKLEWKYVLIIMLTRQGNVREQNGDEKYQISSSQITSKCTHTHKHNKMPKSNT
jgi:hypothetical protein